MSISTVPPPIQEGQAPQLLIKWCDSTEELKQYSNTGYARIMVKREMAELIEQANDKSIKNVPPHVISLHFECDGKVDDRDFKCICQTRRELEGV